MKMQTSRIDLSRYTSQMKSVSKLPNKATLLVAIVSIASALASPAETRIDANKGDGGENAKAAEAMVELTPEQLNSITISPVETHKFPVEIEAVGSIDFNEETWVQVYPPYQGKIIDAFVQLGDRVQKDQPLYTIDSPDLMQAEATAISAAATLELTNKELERARALRVTNNVSERETEQAVSDQQTAEGALQAARNVLRLFGKANEEIDKIIASRKIDPALVVVSPLNGKVTSRNVQPGLFVQPGNSTAPYSIADTSSKWFVANVCESDCPLIRVGQPLRVTVAALPGRLFEGKISATSENVDPSTHRLMIRSVIEDKANELRQGMLANFVIRVKDPVEAIAIPVKGVVREGDGTMTAWVTKDRHHFYQKTVKIGPSRDDRYIVFDGLHPGDLAVVEGAVFLSNILNAPPAD